MPFADARRKLIARGYDPDALAVLFQPDGTVCLKGRVGAAVVLIAEEHPEGIRFAPYRENRAAKPERVPLSGAARGRFGGDVSVPLLGVDRRVEVKCRGAGFRRLYAWLDDADFLILWADRLEPLVVIPLRLGVEIAAVAERARGMS